MEFELNIYNYSLSVREVIVSSVGSSRRFRLNRRIGSLSAWPHNQAPLVFGGEVFLHQHIKQTPACGHKSKRAHQLIVIEQSAGCQMTPDKLKYNIKNVPRRHLELGAAPFRLIGII